MKRIFVALVLLGVAIAFPGAAADLLTNPNFDANANGWTLYSSAWNGGADQAGIAGHGSVLASVATGAFGSDIAQQCVNMPTGGTYSVGGWFYLSPNESGYITISYYEAPNCTGVTAGAQATNWVTTPGSWQFATFTGGTTVVPGPSMSALVMCVVINNGAAAQDARLDTVHFGPGVFPVSLTHFEAE